MRPIKVFFKRVLTRLGLRNKQSCKRCGINQHVVWKVADSVWGELPKKWHNKALCIECFAELHPNLYVSDIDIMDFV